VNRKKFIATLGLGFLAKQTLTQTALLESASLNAELFNDEATSLLRKIPFLKPGDTIGITSPAGYMLVEDCAPGITILEKWGFKTKLGSSIGKKWNTFGGTDAERTKDLQDLINDTAVKAIMCARGGYGSMRILDNIDWKPFVKNPKWLIGFSDITALHCHVYKWFIPSIHSKMLNSFPKDGNIDDTQDSIRKILVGEKLNYSAPFNTTNKLGEGMGRLIGGNLSIVYNMVGTKSDINTKGAILFLEDVSEQLYSVDRMLWNIKRSGKLDGLAGLIIGGFNRLKDDEKDPFVLTVQEMVHAVTKEYKYPICFDFPCGHQKNNFALQCGAYHKLAVANTGTTLTPVKPPAIKTKK
jgi:muramoyltetrapeptide carboxypeptidase